MAVDIGIDEGGDGDDLWIACQLGIVEQAKKLKRQWRDRLREDGLSFFHSVEYQSESTGVFAECGMKTKARRGMLRDLSSIIRNRMCGGISLRVSERFYNSHTTERYRAQHGTAFTYLVQMMTCAAYMKMNELGLGNHINVLLAQGHRHCNQAKRQLELMQADNAKPESMLYFDTVGVGFMRDHPILQAADMLVYSEWHNICAQPEEIWGALHVDPYQAWYIDCNLPEMIELLDKGAEAWRKAKFKFKQAERNEKRKRVQEVRSDNANDSPGGPKACESGDGSGEAS